MSLSVIFAYSIHIQRLFPLMMVAGGVVHKFVDVIRILMEFYVNE